MTTDVQAGRFRGSRPLPVPVPALQPVENRSPGFASNPRRVGERRVSPRRRVLRPCPDCGRETDGDVLALVHSRSNMPAVVAQGIEAAGREESACRIGMAIHPGC